MPLWLGSISFSAQPAAPLPRPTDLINSRMANRERERPRRSRAGISNPQGDPVTGRLLQALSGTIAVNIELRKVKSIDGPADGPMPAGSVEADLFSTVATILMLAQAVKLQ